MDTTKLKDHYRELYKQHGDSPASAQWRDQATQHRRYQILIQPIENTDSILDVGCGLGELISLLQKQSFKGQYQGVDFVPELVEGAKQKWQHLNWAKFSEYDLTLDDPPEKHDWIVVSGVFNNLIKDNKNFIQNSLKKLFTACNKGVAFNCLSTYVDYQDANLYYQNPLELFDYCKQNICKRLTLRHDYLVKLDSIPFEFTMYLIKD